MSRGDAAAGTRIVRGDESRRRRGCDVDIQWRQVARLRYDPPDELFDRFEHLIMAVLSGQGLLAPYFPTAVEFLLKRFEQWGLLRLLRDYFGDEPAISSKKWTLRRGSGLTFPGWHQDGFFMDKGSRYRFRRRYFYRFRRRYLEVRLARMLAASDCVRRDEVRFG